MKPRARNPRVASLAKAIADDARRKKALDKQFWAFYQQMKKAIRARPQLKELEVPLERTLESVKAAAYGISFGSVFTELKQRKNWPK